MTSETPDAVYGGVSWIALALFVVAVIVGVIVTIAYVTKKYRQDQRKNTPDGVQFGDYVRRIRRQQEQQRQEQRKTAEAERHGHTGRVEKYPEIVGSLGKTSDEGCPELAGIRLISHDEAYESSEGELQNTEELEKAIVLGEVLNSPRFKKPFGRR